MELLRLRWNEKSRQFLEHMEQTNWEKVMQDGTQKLFFGNKSLASAKKSRLQGEQNLVCETNQEYKRTNTSNKSQLQGKQNLFFGNKSLAFAKKSRLQGEQNLVRKANQE